ncbi:hypothetical protein SCARR_04252 [Pontiella sulfatireligans]|uniref:Uncharacterized protein n=1 Tax=Pontiella sulfatireligans TaxID=2750658 RepID=A0A6C2UPE2_9BACT|nr:hypothetical protein SCARR_04252 [Pontiella sulfatireligans]
MAENLPSPLQAGFKLTNQEKKYILVICSLFLVGIVARYLYLKNRNPAVYTPAGIEKMEPTHE